ncbi:MAG: hypothetical protein GXP47_00625 [Acidobacteria bacterium]|nr:hypothetical protein [Acidobacteriota bacterium]
MKLRRHVSGALWLGAWALAVATTVAGCGWDGGIPASLAGVDLTRIVSGEKAQRMVRGMHTRGPSVPQSTTVAFYGGGRPEVVLYISVFPSNSEADRALAAMVDGIRRRPSPFQLRGPDRDGGWRLSGLGQEHLVWVDGSRLVWLQANPNLLRRAREELRHGAGRGSRWDE